MKTHFAFYSLNLPPDILDLRKQMIRAFFSGRRQRLGKQHALNLIAVTLTLLLALPAASRAQIYTVLYSFAGGTDGANPEAPITLDVTTGNLYGTSGAGGSGSVCYGGCGTVFELTSTGIESVLYSFLGPPNDGLEPNGLFRDASGNLFGTTLLGGTYEGEGGDGIVFKIGPNGAERVLHEFKGGSDGDEATSGLTQDPNTGDFYGVTAGGGQYGGGTVYHITATGHETVLYNFGASGTLGNTPEGRLLQDPQTGNLYGMLDDGVACGAVFQFTPAGVETVLHVFGEQRGDGCEPGPGDPGLVMDEQGNLFGTTWFGGTANNGVVFELTAGGVAKVLYKFKGAKKGDGAWPYAGLVLEESTGNLYGTTSIGGTGPCSVDRVSKGCGTIFELSPPSTKHGKWRETVLHSFGGGADGSYPFAGLTQNAQTGILYGTASSGGAFGQGVVFEVLP
jgi:uncharacterized repeat protein (TIGR03803 family)